MKKALIIANMMFASATVWGMMPNDTAAQQSGNRGSAFNMSNVKQGVNETENIGDIYSKIIDGYKQFFGLQRRLKKSRELFNEAQARFKDNDWLPEEAKVLFCNLRFEDFTKYIEKISIPHFSKEDSLKIIEESAKKKAKKFFEQVLGDTELGRDLYNTAEKAIDSVEYVWSPYLENSVAAPSSIRCYYQEEDDLIDSLVHETSHILDWFYRLRREVGQSFAENIFENGYSFEILAQAGVRLEDKQFEYVSIFFETLLKMGSFGDVYIHDYSPEARIASIFWNFLRFDLLHELVVSYNENRSLYRAFLQGCSLDEAKKVISELKKNDVISLHIDTYQAFDEALNREHRKANEVKWKNFLKKLKEKKSDKNVSELIQRFSAVDEGLSELIDVYRFGTGAIESFVFSSGAKTKRISLPQSVDIDWEEIRQLINEKHSYFWVCDWLYEIVKSAVDTRTSFGVMNNKYTSVAYYGRINDKYTLGAYNAFNMVKRLKKGMPIEEIMEELTKPFKPLDITEESAEEFLEFLRR